MPLSQEATMKNRAFLRLRDRNQVTLPMDVVSRFGIQVGDWIELTFSDSNSVQLRPAQIVAAGTPEAERREKDAAENMRRKILPAYTPEEFDRHLDTIEKADLIETEMPDRPSTQEQAPAAAEVISVEELKQKVMSAIEAVLQNGPPTYSR